MLCPDEVALEEFEEALARYPAVVKAVSDSKGAKGGQKSLEALDEYRYSEAPGKFSLAATSPESMGLEDVKSLVEWKLRHGKFRPTLMKLVTSNNPSNVTTTIQEATATYKSNSKASAAVDTLATLRGIGPATASLLLAVLDPDRIVFFGDEVFYWLCCGGKVAPIKYNMKEYRELQQRASELVKRLGVKAVDVEKVAFVVMRGDGAAPTKAKAEGSAEVKVGKGGPNKGLVPGSSAAKAKTRTKEPVAAKRKPGPDDIAVRRSKRGKCT